MSAATNERGCASEIGILVVMLVCAAAEALMYGDFWRWFAMPHFAVAPLSAPVAGGIVLSIRAVHRGYVPAKDDVGWKRVAEVCVGLLLTWAMGYAFHLWAIS